jgi:hypothetical protein
VLVDVVLESLVEFLEDGGWSNAIHFFGRQGLVWWVGGGDLLCLVCKKVQPLDSFGGASRGRRRSCVEPWKCLNKVRAFFCLENWRLIASTKIPIDIEFVRKTLFKRHEEQRHDTL